MTRMLRFLSALAALGPLAMAGASGAPTVFLNHFFVVVDANTYRAMLESGFLASLFAPFEKRTTVRNDKSYTGIYFYGRRTYFELFEPGAEGPVGTSGLAFGVETTGESESVKRLWAEALGGAESSRVTRRTETESVPWFEMTSGPGPGKGLRTWLMEYDRTFLARWYPDLTPDRGVRRSDVLDRYVAKIGQAGGRDAFWLKDVTAVTVALADGPREELTTELRSVGWVVRPEGNAVVLEGPEDVRLRVIPARGETSGITEVAFSLQRPAEAAAHRFGSAELTMAGSSARLQLGPARP
jgi:hypothetical protein